MQRNEKNSSSKRTLSVLLSLIGVTLGVLLATLAVWADYESTAYGFMRRAQTSLTGLMCPVFLGEGETGVISVKVSNPTDRSLSPAIRTEVSTPQEIESAVDSVALAPGESIVVQRSIGPGNVDLGSFIFVYALVYSAYPLPYQENTCGILILPVKGAGLVLIVGTVLSLLGMGSGLYLARQTEAPGRRSGSMVFLVVLTTLALTLALLGWWLPAGAALVISILALVITTGGYLR